MTDRIRLYSMRSCSLHSSSMRATRLLRATTLALGCAGATATLAAPVDASAPAASTTITTAIRTTTVAAPGAVAASASTSASTSAPDVELQSFPRAIPVGGYDNPHEQGFLPISPPDQSATSRDRVSQYVMPYDGRVRVRQYRHAPDESPLLVLRHYTAQLRAQGFTLLVVCDAPCRTPSGLEDDNAPWRRELDPTRQLEQRAFGDRGAYVIGYRRDAVVAVRVGMWDLDVTSTVKIIQADAIDHSAIDRYVQVQGAAPVASAPAVVDRSASAPTAKPRRK